MASTTEDEPAPFGVGASYNFYRADLRFGDVDDVRVEHHSVAGSVFWRVLEALELRATGGGIVDGRVGAVTALDDAHDVEPGWMASIEALWTPWVGEPIAGDWLIAVPFVTAGLRVAASGAETVFDDTETASYTAFDVRVVARAGATFSDTFTLYALASVFGGPVFWDDVEGDGLDIDTPGTDPVHVAYGGGFSLRSPGGIQLFAELTTFSELSVSAGVGWSFGR